MSGRYARDLAIEALADEQIGLEDQIVHLTADRDAYRELAQRAIERVHSLTATVNRLREQHQRLVDEYRALRERTMRDALESAA